MFRVVALLVEAAFRDPNHETFAKKTPERFHVRLRAKSPKLDYTRKASVAP